MKLKASVYYLALETDYPSSDNSGLFLGSDGRTLHRGSREFREKAGIEGSARLLDGRVLNYHSRVNGEIRWVEVIKAPYGLGVRCPLVPMRSAAVDPALIPIGSAIYIKETEGMMLPDGSRHDGIWYAHDVGQAIKDARMDLFAGAGIAAMEAIRAAGIGHLKPLTITVLEKRDGCQGY